MLTAIIPALNAGEHLDSILGQLSARDVSAIVADGGSSDETLGHACRYNASIASGVCGRGTQLARGARWANKTCSPQWYLFLHADSRLGEGWDVAVTLHMNKHPDKAGYFRFRADDTGWKPRLMEFCVRFRELTFGGPYGDQGLLISRELYERIGGYEPVAIFEDVKIIDAIKEQKALRRLPANLYTCVREYKHDGYWARTKRNLGLYKAYRRGAGIDQLLAEYKQSAK